MAKRVSVRGIRKNRHYTYDDASDALGVSVQTVRSWRAKGLQVMAERTPHLILGEDMIHFVQTRQQAIPKPAPDQFRCFKCRHRTRPLDRIAFYTPLTPTRGQLEAFCEVCEGTCFKFAGEKGFASLAGKLEIVRNNATQA